MPFQATISGQNFRVDLGQLADPTVALQALSNFDLVSDVLAGVLDQPISTIGGDFVTAELNGSNDFSWQQKAGANTTIQFGVTPSVSGSLTVRKAGTVFPSGKPDITDDPGTSTKIDVPSGKAYVSISFQVSLNVTGQAAFSSGNFGVKAGIANADRFTLANHLIFDAATHVRTAIQQAFEHFRFPFGQGSAATIGSMNSGDVIESEFIGNLNLTASATYGFSHAFFGAAAASALSLSANSPIGSAIASTNPKFDLGLTFSIGYQHLDAFRLLILGQDATITVQTFRIDRSDLTTSFTAAVKIDPALSLNVKDNLPTLLNNSAAGLIAKAPAALQNAFTNAVGQIVAAATQPIDQAAADINNAILDVIKKLPTLGVSLGITFETVTENTVLASYSFDKPLTDAAWNTAMQLDLAGTLAIGGVHLGVGSYVQSQLTKATTLSFTFFGLKAQTVEQYQQEITFEYAGNGMFHFRSKQGISASSDIFGSIQNADFYFAVAADTTTSGTVSGTGVTMVLSSGSTNNPNKTRNVSFTLAALLPDNQSLTILLASQSVDKPNLPVKITASFPSSLFSRIVASQFVSGKPQPIDHQVTDVLNFNAFVKAVDLVGGPFEQFPDPIANYGVWARVNRNLFGDSNHTPDRSATNPMLFTNPQQAYAGLFDGMSDDKLRVFSIFLEEARHFMNLCADLQNLAVVNVTDLASLSQLNDSLQNILKLDASVFPLFFLNAVLVTLVGRMNGKPKSVTAPTAADIPLQKFEVAIQYA